MDKIIIYGTGPFAEQVKYKFEDDGIEVVAFTEGKKFKSKDDFLGLPVYEFEILNKIFSPDVYKIFVAIGYTHLNSVRENVCKEVVDTGYSLFSFISSKAYVSKTAKIGYNSFISEGVSVGVKSIIGNGVIVLSNVVIGNFDIIRDNVYISHLVSFGGYVVVENNCFIGMNSTIRDGLRIKARNIIGSAANVTKETEIDSLYVGNPAKKSDKKSCFVNI